MKRERDLWSPFVGIFVLLANLTLTPSTQARIVSEFSREEQQQLQRLADSIGIDEWDQRVTKSYSQEMIDALLRGLQHPNPRVTSWVLRFYLIPVVKQVAIPKSVVQTRLVPRLQELTEAKDKGTAETQVGESAKDALWHFQVREFANNQERKKFLIPYVHPSVGNRYSTEAMEYLVQIGDEEILAIMKGTLENYVKVHRDRITKAQLENNIAKIEVVLATRVLDEASHSKHLREKLEQTLGRHEGLRADLVQWLVWRLEDLHHPQAVQVLKDIRQDKTWDTFSRDAAQRSLLRLRAIRPEEKIEFFQY